MKDYEPRLLLFVLPTIVPAVSNEGIISRTVNEDARGRSTLMRIFAENSYRNTEILS